MKLRNVVTAFVLTLAFVGCGGDGPTNPGDPDGGGGNPLSGPMKATIDGSPWASVVAGTIGVFEPSSNSYTIVGAEQAVGGRALLISLMSVTGPGTYTIPSALPFRYANTSNGTQVWETNDGTSGSVVVTTATPTRFAGTFSFTAKPTPNSPASNTLVVTNGSFDVTISP